MTYDGKQVGARIREVASGLETALVSNVEVARGILAKRLDEIRVEDRDDVIYAQMDIGPVVLEAVGVDVAGCGCAGPQNDLAPPQKQGLTGIITVRLANLPRSHRKM